MLYLRTASGSYIRSTVIVALAPQHGEDGRILGWMAARADGSTTPLASFFSAPGRIETALPHLFPEPPIAAPGYPVIIRTAKPVSTEGLRSVWVAAPCDGCGCVSIACSPAATPVPS